MKRILVPTDFSDQSEFALDFAYQIATKSNSKIVLLHIIEYPATSVFSAAGEAFPDISQSDFMQDIMERAKDEINSIIKDSKFKDITLKNLTKVGTPFISISKVISEEEADLVVMGTTGSTGFDELFVGTNTEKVVRMARCPVISLPQKANLNGIKNIVYPTNFDFNEKLINHLKEWQKLCDAQLHIVRINTPHNFESEINLNKNLKEFAESNSLKHYTLNIHNCITVEEGIFNFMEEINGDMVAIGTHGRRGLTHLFTGSIAEDVVNHTLKPVWTFSLKN